MLFKFKTGASLKLPKDVCLVPWETLFVQLCIFLPLPRSSCIFLYANTFFIFFEHLCTAKACLFFWQVVGGMWQHMNKSLFTIRTDVGCLWTILLIKLSMMFWSLTDSIWEWAAKTREEGRHREKSVPQFPKAMKRDFDFIEKNQVSSQKLFLKGDCFLLMKCDTLVRRLQEAALFFPFQSS